MILPPEKLVPVASLDNYIVDPGPYAWGELLAPFCPPLPRDGRVMTLSAFGDVFVQDRDGAVWWLNGLEERADRIAISEEQYLERLSLDSLIMLKTKLLEQLMAVGTSLPVGYLFGLRTPRSEGGTYHPDNIGTAPIADAFAYMGERFQRKNAPPPGAAASGLAMPTLDKKKPEKSGLWGKKS